MSTTPKFLSIFFLASIAPFFTPVHAQSSNVQIYGNVDLGITYVSNTGGDSKWKMDSGISRPSRIGFRATEDLGGGNKASFVLESGIAVDTGGIGDSSSFFNRDSHLALHNPTFGTVRLGRQTDFFLGDLDIPDSTPLVQGGLSAGINGFLLPYGVSGPAPAVSMHYPGAKYNNSIKWIKDFNNIRAGLMYGVGAENKKDEIVSGMLRYASGNFRIGMAYTKDNYTTALFSRETFAIKASYRDGKIIYFGNAGFGKDTRNKAQARPVELGFQYAMTDQWKFGAGMGYVWATTASGEKARIIQPFLGTKYSLSKRTELYAMAASNRTTDKSVVPASVGVPGGASVVSTSKVMNVFRFGVLHNF